MRVGLETAGGNSLVIHLSTTTITRSFTSAGSPPPTDPGFNNDVAVTFDPFEFAKSHFFDTSSWGPFCDVTLTLKKARQPDSGGWVKIDDYRCRQSFRHFMSLLDRAVYGAAFRPRGQRFRSGRAVPTRWLRAGAAKSKPPAEAPPSRARGNGANKGNAVA